MGARELGVEVRGDTLPEAIEALMKRVVAHPGSTMDRGAVFLVGFDAEGDDPEDTISRSVDTVLAIASENDAIVVDCMVDGFRKTGEGYRVWGTLECLESSVPAPQSTRVDALTVAENQNGWTISATMTVWKDES